MNTLAIPRLTVSSIREYDAQLLGALRVEKAKIVEE